MKSVLLIGGTGVLSSAVTKEALHQGISVTMINRGKRKLLDGVEAIVSDKNDYRKIKAELEGRRFDAVVDFLCYHKPELEKSFEFYSKYTSQYFFISSCAVYNAPGVKVVNEDAPKSNPKWKYSVEKWECEQRLVDMAKISDCHYTVVRPSVTYGDTRIPYGIAPGYGHHWTLVARILADKPIMTWNNGSNYCNMLRVEDFAVGLIGLIGNERAYDEAFNICSDVTYTHKQVLDAVSKVIGKSWRGVDVSAEFYAQLCPGRAGEMLGGRAGSGFCGNAKLKEVVPNFRQEIDLEEGVRRTIEAYRQQNFQHGIDWAFEGECDKVIRAWLKSSGEKPDGNLVFKDYLGNATMRDRLTYHFVSYPKSLLSRLIRLVLRLKNISR